MKCPFRKSGRYKAGQNGGKGYPVEWIRQERFDECIGEECMAYGIAKNFYPNNSEESYCKLCEKIRG